MKYAKIAIDPATVLKRAVVVFDKMSAQLKDMTLSGRPLLAREALDIASREVVRELEAMLLKRRVHIKADLVEYENDLASRAERELITTFNLGLRRKSLRQWLNNLGANINHIEHNLQHAAPAHDIRRVFSDTVARLDPSRQRRTSRLEQSVAAD